MEKASGWADNCAVACSLIKCKRIKHSEVLKDAIRYRPKCS